MQYSGTENNNNNNIYKSRDSLAKKGFFSTLTRLRKQWKRERILMEDA